MSSAHYFFECILYSLLLERAIPGRSSFRGTFITRWNTYSVTLSQTCRKIGDKTSTWTHLSSCQIVNPNTFKYSAGKIDHSYLISSSIRGIKTEDD